MKRYQCIKDFRMSHTAFMYPGALAFKSGKIYTGEQVDQRGLFEFNSEVSPCHPLSLTTVELHFQELLDLHVDEHEADTYRMPIPDKRLKIGVAIVIATVLTVLALIFLS